MFIHRIILNSTKTNRFQTLDVRSKSVCEKPPEVSNPSHNCQKPLKTQCFQGLFLGALKRRYVVLIGNNRGKKYVFGKLLDRFGGCRGFNCTLYMINLYRLNEFQQVCTLYATFYGFSKEQFYIIITIYVIGYIIRKGAVAFCFCRKIKQLYTLSFGHI